jgi:hypothetical protein
VYHHVGPNGRVSRFHDGRDAPAHAGGMCSLVVFAGRIVAGPRSSSHPIKSRVRRTSRKAEERGAFGIPKPIEIRVVDGIDRLSTVTRSFPMTPQSSRKWMAERVF